MEEIFKQYGAPIIIVTVIVALIAIFTFLMKDNGAIVQQFQQLITNFFSAAKFTPSDSAPGAILAGMCLLG